MKELLIPYMRRILCICLVVLGVIGCLLQKSNYYIVFVMLFCIGCNCFYIAKKRYTAKNVAQLILNALIVVMFTVAFRYEGGIEYLHINIVTIFAKYVEIAAVIVVAVATIYNYHGFEIKNQWLDLAFGVVMNFLYALCTGVLLEMIFNSFEGMIDKQYFAIGIFAMFLMFLLVYGITSSYKLPGLILAPLFVLFTIANQFVYSFRGTPMLLSDLKNIRTASEVAGNYRYHLSGEMIIGIVCVYALVVLLIRSLKWKKAERKRIVWYVAGLVCAIAVNVCGWKFLVNKKCDEMRIDYWNIIATYQQYGTPMTLISTFERACIWKPDGYSAAKVEQIATEIQSQEAGSEKIQPTKIIVIMNEAFSDLSVNGNIVTNEPYMPYFDSLEENVIKGSTLVSVLGGATCNTEYEFLTGNALWYTPGVVPYVSLIEEYHPSLVSTLESQGYTPIALHGYYGHCWNRENVYSDFGFEDFVSLEDLEGNDRLAYVREYASDESLYRIIEDTVVGAGSEKQFLFAVTMQNHGSYEYPDFDAEIQCENVDSDILDQYLSLIKVSDDAFQQLITFFSDYEEPTMIVMFGDHQPGMSMDVWEKIIGKSEGEMTDEDRRGKYQTPFVIWANYEMEAKTDVLTSTNYLSSMMLEAAGLDMTAYNRFLLDMQEEIPAMNTFGYYDSNYEFHAFENEEASENTYLKNYQYLMYNQLEGIKKMKQDVFFLPED